MLTPPNSQPFETALLGTSAEFGTPTYRPSGTHFLLGGSGTYYFLGGYQVDATSCRARAVEITGE